MKIETRIKDKALKLGLFNISQQNYDLEKECNDTESKMDFLYKVLNDELYMREYKSRERRWIRSKLDRSKTFENFDSTDLHGIRPIVLVDLKSLDWIDSKTNIIFLGPTGTGKTHLANAIGNLAIEQGYKVQLFHFDTFVEKISSASKNQGKINYMKECDLIIIDEIGYLPITEEESKSFFKILNDLNQKVSLVLTTHLELSRWNDVFRNENLTATILDRVTYQCQVVKTKGVSYRVKHQKPIF